MGEDGNHMHVKESGFRHFNTLRSTDKVHLSFHEGGRVGASYLSPTNKDLLKKRARGFVESVVKFFMGLPYLSKIYICGIVEREVRNQPQVLILYHLLNKALEEAVSTHRCRYRLEFIPLVPIFYYGISIGPTMYSRKSWAQQEHVHRSRTAYSELYQEIYLHIARLRRSLERYSRY